jgi:hypothetical protein
MSMLSMSVTYLVASTVNGELVLRFNADGKKGPSSTHAASEKIYEQKTLPSNHPD